MMMLLQSPSLNNPKITQPSFFLVAKKLHCFLPPCIRVNAIRKKSNPKVATPRPVFLSTTNLEVHHQSVPVGQPTPATYLPSLTTLVGR